jgi:TatD DNase family protein
MSYDFIDIHSHPHFPQYDADREAMLTRLAEAGGATIGIGTDLATSKAVVELALKYPHVYACVGLYPVNIHEKENELSEILALLEDPKMRERIVAVGECGLDYAGNPTDEDKAHQRRLLDVQIDAAAKAGVPVMVHCREAYEDMLVAIKDAKTRNGEASRFHMHFFAGDLGTLNAFLAEGCTVSFTGVVTFASQYNDVVRAVPAEMILAETDAPYVAPVPYRGQRNEPGYVQSVIERLADLRGVSVPEFKAQLRDNTKRVFGI